MILKNKKQPDFAFAPENTVNTLHKNLSFTATEQYKLLRTNIEFTIPEDEKCPIIGVTSPTRSEGKSTTSINLSYVLAEKGSRVLLIDGDLRLPSIAKKLQIESSPGLTDILFRGKGEKMSQYASGLLDTWYILPSGVIPPNPSELLGSSRMKSILESLKEKFDYIILDLPPVNIVSDALSVSNLITGMVVVVREDYTDKKSLEHCMRQLRLSNVNILGYVVNNSKTSKGTYGKYRYGNNKHNEKYGYYDKASEQVKQADDSEETQP